MKFHLKFQRIIKITLPFFIIPAIDADANDWEEYANQTNQLSFESPDYKSTSKWSIETGANSNNTSTDNQVESSYTPTTATELLLSPDTLMKSVQQTYQGMKKQVLSAMEKHACNIKICLAADNPPLICDKILEPLIGASYETKSALLNVCPDAVVQFDTSDFGGALKELESVLSHLSREKLLDSVRLFRSDEGNRKRYEELGVSLEEIDGLRASTLAKLSMMDQLIDPLGTTLSLDALLGGWGDEYKNTWRTVGNRWFDTTFFDLDFSSSSHEINAGIDAYRMRQQLLINQNGNDISLSSQWNAYFDPTTCGVNTVCSRDFYREQIFAENPLLIEWTPFELWNQKITDFANNHYERHSGFDELPMSVDDLKAQWTEQSDFISSTHQLSDGEINGENNIKYTSPNGGVDEVILDENDQLVTNCLNMGTKNDYSPTEHPVKHAIHDYVPYFVFGNCPEDIGNHLLRMTVLPKYIENKVKKGVSDFFDIQSQSLIYMTEEGKLEIYDGKIHVVEDEIYQL